MSSIQFDQVLDGMVIRATRDTGPVDGVHGLVTGHATGSVTLDGYQVKQSEGWFLDLRDDDGIGWHVMDPTGDPFLVRANGDRIIGLADLRRLQGVAADDVWAKLVGAV